MKKINKITGKVIPLAMNDVDTDLIIPAQYLTAMTRQGFGENLFKRLCEQDKDFVFNQEKFEGANILLTQKNFGCGSSREHAVWALQEAGIQAVIANSFADIFSGNSAKNSLLLISLPENIINKMLNLAEDGNYFLAIDIKKQIVFTEDEEHKFLIDPFRKHCLVNGLDDLDYLLSHQQAIVDYEKARA